MVESIIDPGACVDSTSVFVDDIGSKLTTKVDSVATWVDSALARTDSAFVDAIVWLGSWRAFELSADDNELDSRSTDVGRTGEEDCTAAVLNAADD